MTRFEFRLERSEFMQADARPALVSNKMLWAGRIICALVVLFLLFDSSIKLIQLAPAVEGTIRLGYPVSLVRPIGVILLICTVLYTIPRTSILGAMLLTGYLGGAVASQLRIGEPLFSNVLFPVYVGVLLWAGLFLRNEALRALVPLRRPKAAL
jgi:DoxX-like family